MGVGVSWVFGTPRGYEPLRGGARVLETDVPVTLTRDNALTFLRAAQGRGPPLVPGDVDTVGDLFLSITLLDMTLDAVCQAVAYLGIARLNGRAAQVWAALAQQASGPGIRPLEDATERRLLAALGKTRAVTAGPAPAGGGTANDRFFVEKLLVQLGHGGRQDESAPLEAGDVLRATHPISERERAHQERWWAYVCSTLGWDSDAAFGNGPADGGLDTADIPRTPPLLDIDL